MDNSVNSRRIFFKTILLLKKATDNIKGALRVRLAKFVKGSFYFVEYSSIPDKIVDRGRETL